VSADSKSLVQAATSALRAGDDRLYDSARACAVREGVSLSEVLRRAVAAYVHRKP
jgi:hypothetical protein